MDANKLEFLRNLNFHFPHFIDNKMNTKRAKIIKLLQQLPSGEKIPNNIVSLKAFYDSFTESNNKVAKEFLGIPTLFLERETEPLLPDEMFGEQNNVHQFSHIFSELWKLNARQ
ncbi:MAG: hypothetical protein L3J31_00165 [Bacteroidales bacterium]|nr:hypothetical protein [Bacteroidales bacterium]MCF6341203.1 hypothetical protein [Bacteroidales bacterium]